MIELPSRGDHLRHMPTRAANDGNFGDMWSKIEYKSMKSSSKPNGRSNTKHNPIKSKQNKRLDTLSTISREFTYKLATVESKIHIMMIIRKRRNRVTKRSLMDLRVSRMTLSRRLK